jgi:hypothetical protein
VIPIRGLRAPVRPVEPAAAQRPARRKCNRPRSEIHWTPDLEAQLRAMWDAGRTGGDIAEALGFGLSRNAIIGKARRMRLAPRTRAVPETF